MAVDLMIRRWLARFGPAPPHRGVPGFLSYATLSTADSSFFNRRANNVNITRRNASATGLAGLLASVSTASGWIWSRKQADAFLQVVLTYASSMVAGANAAVLPALAEHLVEENLKTPDIPGVTKPEALSDEQAVLILQVVAAGVMAGFEEFPMESALAQLIQPEAAHMLGGLATEEVEKLPSPTVAPEVEKLPYPAAAPVEEAVGEFFASDYEDISYDASQAATPEQFKQEIENRRNKRRREIDRELESVGDERLRGCLKDVFAIGEQAGKDFMALILERPESHTRVSPPSVLLGTQG
jgi:hypothetical protein